MARSARSVGGRAISPTLTARITVTEALAHALLGDGHQTYEALRVADQAMNSAEPSNDPDWLGVFTFAHFAGSVMHALRDLGQIDAAEQHATDVLNLPAANGRTRALHNVLHATVLAGRGDLDGAVEVARPIQQAAAGLKSRRLEQRLNEFAEHLVPHRATQVVADCLDADRSR